jgi:hypothetical protein
MRRDLTSIEANAAAKMEKTGDHSQAVRLTDENGALTEEGIRMCLTHGATMRGDALREQILRQEVYGIKEQ